MPIYEWKRPRVAITGGVFHANGEYEYRYTSGSIHDPIPVPEGEGWQRMYNYQVGKVSGVGDSPSRSVSTERN